MRRVLCVAWCRLRNPGFAPITFEIPAAFRTVEDWGYYRGAVRGVLAAGASIGVRALLVVRVEYAMVVCCLHAVTWRVPAGVWLRQLHNAARRRLQYFHAFRHVHVLRAYVQVELDAACHDVHGVSNQRRRHACAI